MSVQDLSLELDAIRLLRRLERWDMMDLTADGAYWKGEIRAILYRFDQKAGQIRKQAEIAEDKRRLATGVILKGNIFVAEKRGPRKKRVTVTGASMLDLAAAFGKWCSHNGYNIHRSASIGPGTCENEAGDIAELEV